MPDVPERPPPLPSTGAGLVLDAPVPSRPRRGYDLASRGGYGCDDTACAFAPCLCRPLARLRRLARDGRPLANLLRRLVVDPPGHLRDEQSHRITRGPPRDRRRLPSPDHQSNASADPAAARHPRSGAMAVDDAVLLQPPADRYRLVIS